MTETERNEVVVTARNVDPRVVATLRRAAELAAERGHWLGPEHLVAALAEGGRGEVSLFEKWWPRQGAGDPDPYNGFHHEGSDVALGAITVAEFRELARTMLPPATSEPRGGGEPSVEFAVSGPDAPAYRALIEGPDSSDVARPRRYAENGTTRES
ncbi:hypothetical protein ACTD5D_23115 [Nocardia takedensis]|uniref:hypothetical protein n=1 Tax=Nocardia takedensis TaxID=259390 RepID=UPI003F76876E